MKILYVLNKAFGTAGSAASYTFPEQVYSVGMDVTVISPLPEKEDQIVLPDDSATDRFSIQYLPVKAGLVTRIKCVFGKIRQEKPDIVHVFWQPHAFIFPLLWKTVHVFSRSPRWVIDIRSPQILQHGSRSRLKRMLDPIKQIKFDAVFTHEISSAHSQLFKIIKPVTVIPPGVTPLLTENDHGENESKKSRNLRFVYIGALDRTRKLSTLIDAIKLACQGEGSGNSFIVDFYGAGNDMKHLESMVKEEHLEDVVHFPGLLEQGKLLQQLPQYDVGLAFIPDENYFNAPALKTLEYLAAGLFVLGSSTKGNEKYINDYSGFLVENDAQVYADAIGKLLQNDTVRQRDRARISASVRQSHWSTIVKEKLLPAYRIIE